MKDKNLGEIVNQIYDFETPPLRFAALYETSEIGSVALKKLIRVGNRETPARTKQKSQSCTEEGAPRKHALHRCYINFSVVPILRCSHFALPTEAGL